MLLALQATRGVPIHFNDSTAFATLLWRTMSVSIMLFWLVTLVGVGLLLFQPMTNRVLAWSVRLGMLLTLIGLTECFLMTSPNATQQTILASGQQLDLVGAHTVGALDGGPGLPLLGWSTNHGDLRIGHFIGIHAVQVIGLLGLLLLYAALVLPRIGPIFAAVSSPTLAGLMALLATPEGATIAWVHFLAFDLLVGRWAYLDSREREVSPWLMAPVLFLVLMLGPIGFLLYLAVRAVASFARRANVATATTRA